MATADDMCFDKFVHILSKNCQKKLRTVKFHKHIWHQNEKCIKMSTNMPTFGPVVLGVGSSICMNKTLSYTFLEPAAVKGACSDPQPHPHGFFKHIEILVLELESYLEGFMCEVSCTNSA